MNDKVNSGVHWSFWLIATIAFIWNVMGVVNYFVQMNPDVVDAYRASEQQIISGRPAWATAGFAIAVFGGALGGLMLLLRRSAAFYLFIASLLGVIVTMTHTLGIFGPAIEFGAGEIVGIIILPLVLAAFLVWYTRYADGKVWLR